MPSRAAQQQRQFVQWHERVLATDPIACWLLNEKQGTVAYDWVAENGAQNGTHTAVTLGVAGIGDGNTAASYNGGGAATSYTDVYSAALAGRFNGAEGTLMVWPQVRAASVWTDGTERRIVLMFADVNNFLQFRRMPVNGELNWRYKAGGTDLIVTVGGLSTTAVFNMTMTWSAGVDQLKAYIGGVQQGAIVNGLGVWAGVLAPGLVNIGANTFGPATLVWDGSLYGCVLWDRALPQPEIAALSVA